MGGGGIAERPEFYSACDRLGVLVLQDFWMSGDNNGRWAGSYDWPLNHTLYLAAVRDTLLLHRNHPSLLLYDAGNELYPTSKSPPPYILSAMKRMMSELVPDTLLLVSTMTNSTNFQPWLSLAPRDGPYTIMAPELFFERNPGLYDWHDHEVIRFDYPGANMPFQPEIGSVSHPSYRSLLNFLSPSAAKAFPGSGDTNVPRLWTYHKFIGFTPTNVTPAGTPVPSQLVVDQVYTYGTPINTSEYCVRAQLAQFVQFRALFESYQSKMWDWYSAAIFWKSQGPWPALRGALYDWYLAPTGGYYGVRAALLGGEADVGVITPPHSSPAAIRLHAQLNQKSKSLVLVAGARANAESLLGQSKHIWSTGRSHERVVSVIASAYDLTGCSSGTLRWSRHYAVSTPSANGVSAIPNSQLSWAGTQENSVLLYRIEVWTGLDRKLKPGTGSKRHSIADYWLSDWTNASKPQNYTALGKWRDDTSNHVSLTGSVKCCTCSGVEAVERSCEAIGCGTGSFLVSIKNHNTESKRSLNVSTNTNNNCSDKPIAFGVVSELHFANMKSGLDSRVLPTIYSDGLFSLIEGEERQICLTPGPGSLAGGKRLEVKLSGWNVQDLTLKVPKCDADNK